MQGFQYVNIKLMFLYDITGHETYSKMWSLVFPYYVLNKVSKSEMKISVYKMNIKGKTLLLKRHLHRTRMYLKTLMFSSHDCSPSFNPSLTMG